MVVFMIQYYIEQQAPTYVFILILQDLIGITIYQDLSEIN